jgi:phosphomannomutase
MEGIQIKLKLIDLDQRITGIIDNNKSNINDNITYILDVLSGIGNNHIKDLIRDLGLEIGNLRNDLTERIEICERKLEEHDNILANILSRLTNAGI